MESRGTDEPPPAEEDENSAWEPQKLRKGRGHTVRWWPERRGKGTRGEDSTITHSVTSPTVGWQQIYAKGKQPRALRVSNQGGKSSRGRIVLQGKGANPAAELQLAQSISRAAAAKRRSQWSPTKSSWYVIFVFFLFLDGQPKRCGQSSGKFKETIYLSWWIFQVYDCLVEGRFVFFGGKHHFLMDSTSRFFIQPFLIPSPNSS